MSDSPIVISDKRHGLPFSKGLMAQSFTATGLSPLRAYKAAQLVCATSATSTNRS